MTDENILRIANEVADHYCKRLRGLPPNMERGDLLSIAWMAVRAAVDKHGLSANEGNCKLAAKAYIREEMRKEKQSSAAMSHCPTCKKQTLCTGSHCSDCGDPLPQPITPSAVSERSEVAARWSHIPFMMPVREAAALIMTALGGDPMEDIAPTLALKDKNGVFYLLARARKCFMNFSGPDLSFSKCEQEVDVIIHGTGEKISRSMAVRLLVSKRATLSGRGSNVTLHYSGPLLVDRQPHLPMGSFGKCVLERWVAANGATVQVFSHSLDHEDCFERWFPLPICESIPDGYPLHSFYEEMLQPLDAPLAYSPEPELVSLAA